MSQSDFVRRSVDYGGWDPSSIFSGDDTEGVQTREGENPNGRSNLELLNHEKCINRNKDVSLKRRFST